MTRVAKDKSAPNTEKERRGEGRREIEKRRKRRRKANCRSCGCWQAWFALATSPRACVV